MLLPLIYSWIYLTPLDNTSSVALDSVRRSVLLCLDITLWLAMDKTEKTTGTSRSCWNAYSREYACLFY